MKQNAPAKPPCPGCGNKSQRSILQIADTLKCGRCGALIVAKKKVVGKTAKGTRSKMKSAGNSKADPNQQNLPGVEPDPRIPMIESSVKRLLQIKSEKAALKEEADQLQDKVAGLLEKNKLTTYKCLGKEVFLEPNGFKLKIKTAKG